MLLERLGSRPAAFVGSPAFAADPTKQAQWRAFIRKVRLPEPVPEFEEAVAVAAAFVMPAVEAVVADDPFERRWEPGGPWR